MEWIVCFLIGRGQFGWETGFRGKMIQPVLCTLKYEVLIALLGCCLLSWGWTGSIPHMTGLELEVW